MKSNNKKDIYMSRDKESIIHMGKIKVVKKPSILTCVGLGSCIGFFLYDRNKKIGGAAHITISENKDLEKEKSLGLAKYAIDGLIEIMASMGSNIKTLRAKIVGGAQVFPSNNITIGTDNVEAVKNEITRLGIYLAAEDTGGTVGKTARFNTLDGSLEVKTALGEQYII